MIDCKEKTMYTEQSPSQPDLDALEGFLRNHWAYRAEYDPIRNTLSIWQDAASLVEMWSPDQVPWDEILADPDSSKKAWLDWKEEVKK